MGDHLGIMGAVGCFFLLRLALGKGRWVFYFIKSTIGAVVLNDFQFDSKVTSSDDLRSPEKDCLQGNVLTVQGH